MKEWRVSSWQVFFAIYSLKGAFIILINSKFRNLNPLRNSNSVFDNSKHTGDIMIWKSSKAVQQSEI